MNAAADADEEANGEKMLEQQAGGAREGYPGIPRISAEAVGTDRRMHAAVPGSGSNNEDGAALQPVSSSLPHDDVSAVDASGEGGFATEGGVIGNGTAMEVDDLDDRTDASASGFVLLEAEEGAETEDDSGSISTVSSIGGSVMSFTQEGGDGSGSDSRITNDSAGGRVRSRNKRERVGPMGSPGSRRGRRGGRVN